MIKGLLHEFKQLWEVKNYTNGQLRGLLAVFTIIPVLIVVYRFFLHATILDSTSIGLLTFVILNILIYPFSSRYFIIYKLWMSLAVLLGFVVSNIFLSIFFFVILTPVGFFMRIFGKDPLKKGFRTNEETYWQTSLKKNYRKQF